jgi:hypothetical protein
VVKRSGDIPAFSIYLQGVVKEKVKMSLCLTNETPSHEDVWREWIYRPTFS